MFEQMRAQDAGKSSQCLDFVKLYERFIADSLKVSEAINNGSVTNRDRFRMRQFASRVDSEWQKIPVDLRKDLVEMLLIKKLLPGEVALAIKHLEARVVGLS